MKLFEVTNTTWENLPIATHKTVSTPNIVLICALRFANFLRLCLSPRTTSRTISFSLSNSFLVFIWCLFSILARCSLSFVLVCASLLGPRRGRNCRCLWLWQLGFGVSLRAAMSNLSVSPPPNTPLISNRSVLHDGRKHKTVVFLQSNAVREEARRTNLPLFAIGRRRWPCRRFRCPSNLAFNSDAQSWNGIGRSHSHVVVPQSLPVSATMFPTALSLYIAQGRLRKNIRYPSCSQDCCRRHLKKKIHQLGLFFLAWSTPTKCCWVIHGRLTSEHKTSTSPSLFIPPPPPPPAQAPGSLSSHACMNQTAVRFLAPTGTLEHLSSSTRDRVDHSRRCSQCSQAKNVRRRRAVDVIICMITREFSLISITSQGLSLYLFLFYSRKVTHAQYTRRFDVPITQNNPKRVKPGKSSSFENTQ